LVVAVLMARAAASGLTGAASAGRTLGKEEPHCLAGRLDDGTWRIRIARCVST
jgi:hypothetical protein